MAMDVVRLLLVLFPTGLTKLVKAKLPQLIKARRRKDAMLNMTSDLNNVLHTISILYCKKNQMMNVNNVLGELLRLEGLIDA